jgi:rubrerythrin
MADLVVPSHLNSVLDWDYDSEKPAWIGLYEKGKKSQWNASTDIDWTIPVDYGSALPDDSVLGVEAFRQSPLLARGRPSWDEFRWEFQAFMVSQFLHGEQGALITTARLVEELPDLDAKFYAASQVADEARHVEAFRRYLRLIPAPYQITGPLASLLSDLLSDKRWDITALGMQIMVEALAMAAFRMANTTFNDPLIKKITELVARDEARHVAFGISCLGGLYDEMTDGERAEREDFVLSVADTLRQRFMLEDIWQRMDVPRNEGARFVTENETMRAYRRAVFTKVVSSVRQIGLLTGTVRDGLIKLDLLG